MKKTKSIVPALSVYPKNGCSVFIYAIKCHFCLILSPQCSRNIDLDELMFLLSDGVITRGRNMCYLQVENAPKQIIS